MVARAAVGQHAALDVDGGVEDGIPRPAVFGLHVEDGLAHLDVGVEAKDRHRRLRRSRAAPPVGLTSCRANPIVPFSGRAHYSIAADPPRNTMNQSYLSSYAPILIHLLAAAGLAGGLLFVNLLGGGRP